MRSKSSGFTLIELLVVVAIIGLLIALLLPSLAAAREQAKTVKCASNMRSEGQIVNLFAAQNDGRGPGSATGRSGSVAWNNILNAEVLQRTTGEGTAAFQFGSFDPRTLGCPNFVEPAVPWGGYANETFRPMVYNAYAAGDAFHLPDYGTNNLITGAAGSSVWDVLYPADTPLTNYVLGAKLQFFRADQFMLYESFAGNDVGGPCVTPLTNGSIATRWLIGFPEYSTTDWSSGDGVFPTGYSRDSMAFRHPFLKGTNILFFDGHVATLKPGDDVADGPNKRSHWALDTGS